MTRLLWFEGLLDDTSAVVLTSGFLPRSISGQAYSPAFSVWMAVHPEYFRGWAFVASYSSATVAEFHGIPCADVVETKTSQRTGRSVNSTRYDFKKIQATVAARAHVVRRSPDRALLPTVDLH